MASDGHKPLSPTDDLDGGYLLESRNLLVIPNHLHFFAWPGRLHADVDDWVQYWKSIFTKRLRKPDCRWQRASFHHRIRSDESAEERRAYMIENPVRAGLVQRACDWPYGGEVFKPGFWW